MRPASSPTLKFSLAYYLYSCSNPPVLIYPTPPVSKFKLYHHTQKNSPFSDMRLKISPNIFNLVGLIAVWILRAFRRRRGVVAVCAPSCAGAAGPRPVSAHCTLQLENGRWENINRSIALHPHHCTNLNSDRPTGYRNFKPLLLFDPRLVVHAASMLFVFTTSAGMPYASGYLRLTAVRASKSFPPESATLCES
jgi:hypothetical protein